MGPRITFSRHGAGENQGSPSISRRRAKKGASMKFSCSTQTIAWFKDRYLEESLVIRPPYQRKPVWAARQKCTLVESILKGLPVPEIYVQRSTNSEGSTMYAVVDGQQRIRAVLQFAGSETDPEEVESNKFVLDKLPNDSPWKNQSIVEFSETERRAFFGYDFAVRFLDTDDDNEVRDMFKRLNRFLTPLNAQELRNATYLGPFAQLALQLANDDFWAENHLVSPGLIRRMRDVEFVSDLLIGVIHGPQGGSAAVIDTYYERYEDFEDEFPDQPRVEKQFTETLRAIRRITPDLRGTRWSNRTDFYTLFVAIAEILSHPGAELKKPKAARAKLQEFAESVYERLADESIDADADVVAYVRAVEKGANDKNRRAARDTTLKKLLRPYFSSQGK